MHACQLVAQVPSMQSIDVDVLAHDRIADAFEAGRREQLVDGRHDVRGER